MTSGIRKQVADSHIAAISVALLVLWAFESAFNALETPVAMAMSFVFEAIAILGVPYSSPGLSRSERFQLTNSLEFAAYSLIELTTAWIISNWAYGENPARMMGGYWRAWNGRHRVGAAEKRCG